MKLERKDWKLKKELTIAVFVFLICILVVALIVAIYIIFEGKLSPEAKEKIFTTVIASLLVSIITGLGVAFINVLRQKEPRESGESSVIVPPESHIEKLPETGIENVEYTHFKYFNNKDFAENFKDAEKIDMCINTGARMMEAYRKDIANAFWGDKCYLRILLIAPSNPVFKTHSLYAALSENKSKEDILDELEKSLRVIYTEFIETTICNNNENNKNIKNKKRRISIPEIPNDPNKGIRFMKCCVNGSYTIMTMPDNLHDKKKRGQIICYFTPYFPHLNSNESYRFTFVKNKYDLGNNKEDDEERDFVETCQYTFNQMWEKSEKIEGETEEERNDERERKDLNEKFANDIWETVKNKAVKNKIENNIKEEAGVT